MKNVFGLLLKALVTTALVACSGQSSDPLKDYKDVKAVPIHNKQSETQTFEVDKFSVNIAGANETNYGNFIEGKEGYVTIRITPKIEKIDTPTFDIINFPTSDQPKVVRVSNDTYKLVWTPKAGTIPQGQSQTQINFQVNVTASGQVDEVKTLFLVSRTNKVPKIKGTDGLKANVEEGQTIQFSVDIEDPNYNGSGVPELLISPYMNSNIEAFMANGSTYIFQNYKQKQNPVQLGAGVFRYYYEMKLDKLPDLYDRKGKLDENGASVQLCFNLRAVSVVQTTSGITQHCIEARYAAQPAQATFNSAERKVIAGQKNTIGFKLATATGLSSIEIKNAKSQLASLPGEKDLVCNGADDKNSSLNCELSWTPSCNMKAKNASLRLRIDSKLNSKTKTSNIDEQFEISNESCAALAAAKAEADKKAAAEKAAEKAAAKAAAKTTATAKAKAKPSKKSTSNVEKKS